MANFRDMSKEQRAEYFDEMMAKARISSERREMVKTVFGGLFHEARTIVNKHDPCGFIAMGAPTDEYEGEVGTILPRMKEAHCVEDAQRIVWEEFVHWFGEASFYTGLDVIGADIWEAWREWGYCPAAA